MELGAVFWLGFFALAACALLCKLGELVLDGAAVIAGAWRTRARRSAAMAEAAAEPFPWVDAQIARFDSGHDGDSEELEPPLAPWEPPVAPVHATCPTCSRGMLPVLYGYPSGDVIAAAEQDLIILGGCIPGGARYRCACCGDPWRSRSCVGHEPNARAAGLS